MKKFLAILLAVATLLSLCSCGLSEKKDKKKNNGKEESTAAIVENQANNINGNTNVEFTDYLVAEKIGTLDRDRFTTNTGGLLYEENGLNGIISYEGLYDTGAIYAYADSAKNYFIVRKTNPSSVTDLATINSAQLVDCRGKAVIPGTFAAYDVISSRFVVAVKATARTYDSKKVIMYYNSDTGSTGVSNGPLSSYAWYEGEWFLYDITTGSVVPGASGNHQTYFSPYGGFISFKNAAGNYVKINAKGEPLPENATLFSDGSYRVESKVGDVYTTDGTRLFSYDLTGYVPKYSYGEYYSASKYFDGATTYAVMNTKGEILSEGYTESITIYGDVVHCGKKVYDVNGNVLVAGSYDAVHYDEMFGNNWILRSGDTYSMIDAKGNILLTGSKNFISIYLDEFVACKKINNDYYYYSHKDKDYTIKGYSFAPWIVKVSNANSMYDLVDTMTGKTLLEGYNNYSKIPYSSNAYYVYAKYNGGTDVYLIVSGSQIQEITQMKTNLYNELSAAFSAEGLAVTVDKVNGEIALDTSVLFGGDSAELSAEGKEILNKFIKVYSSVIYSDKYNGFITKTLVEGHTAPLAGSTYASGYSLSLERATNVMNYCLSPEAGVDASSPIANTLEAVGYSNSQPIYKADGTVDLDASRRVSFRFMVNIEY